MRARCVFSRSTDDLPKDVSELLMESPAGKCRGMPAHRRAIPTVGLNLFQCPANRMYHVVLEQNSCRAIDDRIEYASGPKGDYRRSESHRLEWSDPEILDAGKDQTSRARQALDDHLSRYGAEERNVGAGTSLTPWTQRPVADDDEPAAARALDGQLHALVGNQRGDDGVIVVALVVQRGIEKSLIDEGMNDIGIAGVVLPDPVAHEIRIGDEARHARCGLHIPLPQTAGHDRRAEPPQRTRAGKVVVEAIPDVAHRRVAVTGVRLPARIDSLRHAVTGRDDHIVRRQIPGAHRARKKREQLAVVIGEAGRPLQSRGVDDPTLDLRRYRSRKM